MKTSTLKKLVSKRNMQSPVTNSGEVIFKIFLQFFRFFRLGVFFLDSDKLLNKIWIQIDHLNFASLE